jgi:hypothetical protein
LEREILRLLTKQPERRAELRERLGEAPFRDPLSVEIFAGLSEEDPASTPAEWLSMLPSEASRRLVASWAFRDKEAEEDRLYEKCLEDLVTLRRRERSRKLLQELTEAERTADKTVAEALTSEYQGLLRRKEKA